MTVVDLLAEPLLPPGILPPWIKLPKRGLKPCTSLRQLAQAEAHCTRCPLHRDATQAVPGDGPSQADFVLVGEQPGDKEDLAGKPFVGPAAAFSIPRSGTPASPAKQPSSPTRSSPSSMKCAASAGCING
jgi:hypothetical protein